MLPDVVPGRVRWYSLAVLLLLAATLAEFLTGSTPIPRAVANPLGFALLVGMYGGGALLIREVALRWGKRWGAILLLGGAYAVGEEGFGAKTMTDPIGSNIGNQLYSHWAGINWVPLAGLTLFHAAFSIAVPLILMELIFPETRGRRLVGNAGATVAALAYILTVILVSFGDPFNPPPSVTLFLLGYVSAFVALAYLVPRSFLSAAGEKPDRPERRFVLLGAWFLGSFFLIFAVGSHFLPWVITAALFLPLAALTARYLVRHAGRVGNEIVKVDLVLGMIFVFLPLDAIQELGGDVGVLLYDGLVLALLFGLRRRIHRMDSARESTTAGSLVPDVASEPQPRLTTRRGRANPNTSERATLG
jgi:hypothetical protein